MELNRKFCSNLSLALAHEADSMAEVQARAIPAVGKILGEEEGLTDWQKDSLCMFDEVFADITCSIYLAACGLDKPGQTILFLKAKANYGLQCASRNLATAHRKQRGEQLSLSRPSVFGGIYGSDLIAART